MIYAIGDIHGEIRKLRSLLDAIEAEATDADRYVFLGDYVDRGPDTAGVIELLLQTRDRRPNTIFLRGNHEQMMFESRQFFELADSTVDFETAANWFAYGGAETLASYPNSATKSWIDRIPAEHWTFLRGTGLEHRQGPYLFVHAGIAPPGATWTFGEPRLWIREPFVSSQADLGAVVVHGHTPSQDFKPRIMRNKIGIDTGATYGGPLTAVKLDPESPYDPDTLEFLYGT